MDEFDKFWISNPTVSFGHGWGDFAGAVMGFGARNSANVVSGFSLVPMYLPEAPMVVAYYEVVDIFGGMASNPHLRGIRFARVNGKDPAAAIRLAMQGQKPYFDLDAIGRDTYNQAAVNLVATRVMSDFQRLEAYAPFIFNGQVVVDRFRLFHAIDGLGAGCPCTLLTANIVAANAMQQQDGGATGPPRP